MARRALLIHNPAARGSPEIERLRAAAGGVAGWEIDTVTTTVPGHATELARQAVANGLSAAIACGGDGTVNEVANGLASSTTALAVVRGGTANVWAKEIRVPKNPARALQLLEVGETRTIDLGRAGERYFVFIASFGFDAAVVRAIASGPKRWLGTTAYVLHGLRRALGYRSVHAEFAAGPESLSGSCYWAVLGNTRSYGGVVNVTHRARVDDGRLDLFLLRKGGLPRLLWLLPWVLLRRHDRRAHVLYRTVTSLDVATAGLPVQIDGEYLCETPLRFEVVPAALRVIVPRGLRSPLFMR